MSDFEFENGDVRLHVYEWRPEGEPRALVQIVHGMSEHAARYAGLAGELTRRGYVVYAHDQRGHGRSVQNGGQLGHMADNRSFERAADDVARLGAHLRSRHPNLKRALLGHSMGSFHVQRLLYERPTGIDAAVLSASNGKPPPIAAAGRVVARVERARLGKTGQSAVLTALSFGDFNKRFKPNRTEFDWLSRDEAEVDAYVADPFCGYAASTQTWVDLLDALADLTAPANLQLIPKDLPIYVFSGSQDAVGGMGAGVRSLMQSYADAGLTRAELRLYDEGRHEMLHETNKAEVAADLIRWLDAALR